MVDKLKDLSKLPAKEIASVRREAQQLYMGNDDITISDTAFVEKTDAGYWVEARVWVDDVDLAEEDL